MTSKNRMKSKYSPMLALSVTLLTIIVSSCAIAPAANTVQDAGILTESRGEHERDNGGEGGEESGTQYGLDETYDAVRNGARLILNYNAERNAFVDTVENTTSGTLRQVRVEVHLSNGIELGPTKRVDLAPGQKAAVMLRATNQAFDAWTAHPEVGGGEPSGEGEGEHGGEGSGEHSNGG
jgi:hypothetical protein